MSNTGSLVLDKLCKDFFWKIKYLRLEMIFLNRLCGLDWILNVPNKKRDHKAKFAGFSL